MTDDRPARARALEARFAEIARTMRDLPLYNPALDVEAWGFVRLDGNTLIGVLITPWFMNLVLLPETPEPVEPNRYGEACKRALPGGEMLFLYGGDEAVGAFRAASLHSPMDVFLDQPQARAEARLRLAQALTGREEPAVDGGVASSARMRRTLSRRDILRGAAPAG